MASSPNTIPREDAYDVLANFMGPFSLHAVMARALKVPGNRFRLRTPPDSGGSFGVKQARVSLRGPDGYCRASLRPPREMDRGPARASVALRYRRPTARTTLEAAVDPDGRVRALAWDQIEDVGAHIRAPEPATLYRMHGNLTGAYDIRHISRTQSRGTHQQDADRPQPRLRWTAGLLCARTPDAAHRARTESRSARCDPQEPHSYRSVSL